MSEQEFAAGWSFTGSNPEHYVVSLDDEVTLQGDVSAKISSVGDIIDDNAFSCILQSIRATRYRDKKIQLTAAVKTEKAVKGAGLWMRIDSKYQYSNLRFDNMSNRIIKGSRDWNTYRIVLDVPSDSEVILFGGLITGTGTAWFECFELNEVHKDAPTTNTSCVEPYPNLSLFSEEPENMDFLAPADKA